MNRIQFIPQFLLFFAFACTFSVKNNNKKIEIKLFEKVCSSSLRGLYVIDENTVWASGSGGTVLLTTDGGETWNNISVKGAEENDFRSIHAWDDQKALVFGVAGPDFGYLTINSGKSWEVVYSDTTSGLFFNSLKFANEKTGLTISDAVDEKPFLIKTEDGGYTWKRILNIPDAIKGEANFAASNTCIEFLPSGKAWIITGGKTARVFYSENFGKNWDVTVTPMVQGTPSSGIFSVSFKNDREGVIVGGTFDKPELNEKISAYTTNGGKTWNLSEKMPAEYKSCVQTFNVGENQYYIAIGKTGCDISMDKGKNWDFLSEDGFYTIRMVPGKPIGYAAGSNGRIAKVRINI
ncbi:MAG: hypothetical protein JXR31_09830 [Prolixibacteraceae bacterium]|nr:hypothetical protein [Prolixibacteraceae bacterium]MBN2774535.1 hypothetical protein [Prolixibacteraceae bacterium]